MNADYVLSLVRRREERLLENSRMQPKKFKDYALSCREEAAFFRMIGDCMEELLERSMRESSRRLKPRTAKTNDGLVRLAERIARKRTWK